MKIPVWLLRLLPMWDYICPKCRREVEKNSSKCPICGEQYGSPVRVPPKVLNDKKALEDYVHKHVFPRVSKTQRDYLAQYFTDLFSDGFESGDFSAWDGTTNGGGDSAPEVQSDLKYAGSYAGQIDTTVANGYSCCYIAHGSSYATYHVRGYYQISALPLNGEESALGKIKDSSNNDLLHWGICRTAGGQIQWFLYNEVTTTLYTVDATINVDTWYCVEFGVVVDSSTGELHLYVNGDEIIDETNLNTGSTNIYKLYVGHFGSFDSYYGTFGTVTFDCVVVADTYIGPEEEVETYTRTWNADALFKKLGITKSLSVDVALQKQNIPKTFTVDAAFQKSLTIQKQIDSLFKKFDILKSFAVDVRFGALMTQTASRQIDVLLKKLDVTTNFGLDTYFGPVEAETYAKNFGLNVIFAYKVRLPELWLDENGKIVLNISKPYTWVGT